MDSRELQARATAAEAELQRIKTQYEEQREENKRILAQIQNESVEMQANLKFAIEDMQTQIFREMEKTRIQHEREMQEVERRNAELEEKVNREHLRRRQLDQAAKMAAESALNHATQAVEKLKAIPCDFFAPGQAGILRSQLNVCDDLMRQEVWQAALALANATDMSASILSEQVRQSYREWQKMMNLLRKRVENLSQECKDFSKEVLEECTQALTDEERDFWCSGLWIQHLQAVNKITESIGNIDMNNPRDGNMRTAYLNQRLSKVGEVQDEQTALIETIRAECTLSIQREQKAAEMVDPLEDSGFFLQEAGFINDDRRNSFQIKLSWKQERGGNSRTPVTDGKRSWIPGSASPTDPTVRWNCRMSWRALNAP